MSKQLNRIKVILAEKQLTNKWLADELHRDQTTVSRGRQIPASQVLRQ